MSAAHHNRIKAFGEYGPLVGFFVSYWLYGLEIATAVLVVFTLLAVVGMRLTLCKLPIVPLIAAGLVVLFGGLSLIFDDPRFIKMKPTVVQIAMSVVLVVSALLKRPLLATMMSGQITLESSDWQRLSYRYAIFFLAMAALNEYIWRSFSTDFWVNFKFFGLTGCTLLFSLTQVAFIMRRSH